MCGLDAVAPQHTYTDQHAVLLFYGRLESTTLPATFLPRWKLSSITSSVWNPKIYVGFPALLPKSTGLIRTVNLLVLLSLLSVSLNEAFNSL